MAKGKDKERIPKAAREKQSINYKGTSIRLSADFSTETLQARREWQDIFKVLKGKNLQPRILYPAIISFKVEGEIKNFSNKQKLKEYSNTKPILKKYGNSFSKLTKKKKKREREQRKRRIRMEETTTGKQSLK
uniref:L1 transposable element dsRBD-like domain-containing protein n=1 Tax=Sus scrofa TaxID=9823 RepID=A0A8D1CX20_PIG